MFDLRYHVASLAAVFLALVIGILVGVGISDRGLSTVRRRGLLEREVASLQNTARSAGSTQTGRPSPASRTRPADFINETYPALVRNRLTRQAGRGRLRRLRRMAACRSAVNRALIDAGGQQLRLRALKVPIDAQQIDTMLARTAAEVGSSRPGRPRGARASARRRSWCSAATRRSGTRLHRRARRRAGRRDQGPRRRGGRRSHRPAAARRNDAASCSALYEGLGSAGVPAVGVEATRQSADSAIPIFRQAGLSTVDDVDTPVGRLALAAPARRRSRRPVRREGLGRRRRRCRRSRPSPPRVAEPLAILVAARDEEARIGPTVEALRQAFPDADVIVADDGSRDCDRRGRPAGGGARRPAAAARQGPGADARRARGAARERCCSATPTSTATSHRCSTAPTDLAIAAFAERQGGGFGIAKRAARALVRALQRLRGARAALGPARALARRARGLLPARARASAARCG